MVSVPSSDLDFGGNNFVGDRRMALVFCSFRAVRGVMTPPATPPTPPPTAPSTLEVGDKSRELLLCDLEDSVDEVRLLLSEEEVDFPSARRSSLRC